MTQSQQPDQPPVICPLCLTWSMMHYATRHSTPIPPAEALGIMAAGFWLSARGAKEAELCQAHSEMLIRLDLQKHTREEWERTETLRLAQEAEAIRIEAERPKYPTPRHANIAANLLGRLAQASPSTATQLSTHPMMAQAQGQSQPQVPVENDPNSFPCPDCKKPIRNGQVHGCTGTPA
jgi:hypothetical protein